MTTQTAAGPILLDLDGATWGRHLDRAESWLGDVLVAQEKFRKVAADVAPEIGEPHIRTYLEAVAERAGRHQEEARGLFRAIGREPSDGRSALGKVAAKGGELVAEVIGLAGGAHGNWKGLRQLLLANLDALGAFAVAEQLGYALGNRELADAAFRIAGEKWQDQLLIQEYVLEMAPKSILYHEGA